MTSWVTVPVKINGAESRSRQIASEHITHLSVFQAIQQEALEPNHGSIPRYGRSLRGGHGNILWYIFLENPMDREAFQATVHRVIRS